MLRSITASAQSKVIKHQVVLWLMAKKTTNLMQPQTLKL